MAPITLLTGNTGATLTQCECGSEPVPCPLSRLTSPLKSPRHVSGVGLKS